MNIQTPYWFSLSHHEKCRLLDRVRMNRCNSNYYQRISKSNEFDIDANFILDVPSFYLSLGESINGHMGYFGGNLDALNDCLGGGFGIETPICVNVINGNKWKQSLDKLAWLKMKLESNLSFIDTMAYSYSEIENKVIEEIDLPKEHYYQVLSEVFVSNNCELRIYD